MPIQGDPGLHQSQFGIFRCSSGSHLTSMFRISSSTYSLNRAAQIVVEYDGVDNGVVIPVGDSLPRVFIWLTNFYQRFI